MTGDQTPGESAPDQPLPGAAKKTWTPPSVEIFAMSEAEAFGDFGVGGDLDLYS